MLNIGHINAYTPESFALTLATAGLDIPDFRLFDHSIGVHSFHSSPMKARAKMAFRRMMLSVSPSFAPKLLSYHCGALCRLKA